MLEAKRTLVKSGPELWAEVSDPVALARHLGPFGSIRITRSRPESLVEWEGDRAAGDLTLEPSGFGTRVTIRARIPGSAAGEEPAPPPPAAAEPEMPRGFWARLRRRRPAEPAPEAPPPPPAPAVAAASGAAPISDTAALCVLTDALDALGRAHHRPFSRV